MKGKIVNQRFEDIIKHVFILLIKGDMLSNNCAFEKMGGSILKKEIAGIFSKMIKVSNPKFNSFHTIMSTMNQRTPLKQCIENVEHC